MSLADALKGIKEQQVATAPPRQQRERHVAALEPAATPSQTTQRRAGKSSREDYEKVGLYVRTDLRRRAIRQFEDSGGRDLSDLIEELLTGYLNE